MKKTFSIVIISFIFFISCKENVTKNSIETSEITNEFRLQFLNEILSDTIGLKLISSKSDLISNVNIIPPTSFYYNGHEFYKESHYISEVLEIKDTLFVQKQFELNPTFSFDDLSKFGFNIFDVNSRIKSGKGHHYVLDEVSSYYQDYKNCYLLFLSKPIFNKNRNKAYMTYGCGSEGTTIILSKRNNVWEIEKEINSWVE
jgi:hypothetical protein